MADVKISGLPAASTPVAGTEVLPIVQSTTTKKLTIDDLIPKQIRSNSTTGILQVTGPAAAATRVMTTPDANFTVARTDAGQTFTGVNIFTSPKIITDISDTNGNELLKITATASAVNEITVANAATGNNPVLSATGSDTNIGVTLTPKGTGNAVLTSGNLVVANGNGIDFSNTPGTGTSELLADYEEGTWTPGIKFGSGTTGITYGSQTGSYVKIGNLVTVTARIDLTSKGSDSGVAYITGLPFAVENTLIAYNTGAALNSFFNMASISGWVAVRANPNDTVLQLNTGSGSTGVTDVSQGNFTDTTGLGITVTYKAA